MPTLTIKEGDFVCVKKIGTLDEDALFAFGVDEAHFVFEPDPLRQDSLGDMLAELLGLPSAAGARGAKLSDLAPELEKNNGQLVFDRGHGGRKVFVFAITGIDISAGTATVTLDEAIESFVPTADNEQDSESGIDLLH